MELDIQAIVGSYVQLTIFLLMFSVGLNEGFKNLSILWQRPGLLVRCLIAAFVLVPLAGMLVLKLFPLVQETRYALGLMAIIPGAPLTYKKLTGMKGDPHLAGSFQTTMSLFAAILVPLWALILVAIYPAEGTAPVVTVFKQIATVQLIPILLGLAVAEWLPTLAEELIGPVANVSKFMFLGFVIVLLVVALPLLLQVGVVQIIAVLLFITLSILIGHYLGGPEPETRLTIGLANSTRNAGLALYLATFNFGERPGILAGIAAIALLSFVAGAIYSNLYWKQFSKSSEPAPAEG